MGGECRRRYGNAHLLTVLSGVLLWCIVGLLALCGEEVLGTKTIRSFSTRIIKKEITILGRIKVREVRKYDRESGIQQAIREKKKK